MRVWLNGRFLDESDALVPVTDRGFQDGDGCFETVELRSGVPFLWPEHWRRFQQALHELGLAWEFPEAVILQIMTELVTQNRLPSALVRMTCTRGPGPRGYSTRGANTPTRLIMAFPAPARESTPKRWTAHVSPYRIPVGFGPGSLKSTSKLLQILAKKEAEIHGADEALILNTRDEIAEFTNANFFWIQRDQIFTPPLESGCLPGVTRDWAMAQARAQGIEVIERNARLCDVLEADGAFATCTGPGIVEIQRLGAHPFPPHPLIHPLWRLYHKN